MSIFMSNKQAAEKIAGLEARVLELEADATKQESELETLRTENANHAENVVTLTAERDDAVTTLAEANATLATVSAELVTAQAAVAELPDKIASGVQIGIAALGFKGEIPELSNEAEVVEAKSRTEFNALTPRAKMDFIKAGGQLK